MGAGESKNLFQAAAKDEPERAKYFIEHNREDINGKDKDGWTPLHAAAYGGSTEIAMMLLSNGADPKATEKGGRMPLHLAALQGHVQILRLLEQAGADVNLPDSMAMTPLHHAAVSGQVAACKELLDHGARPDPKLSNGATPLHLAAFKGRHEAVQVLITRGANYRSVLSNGRTALHEAAEGGNAETVAHLLSAGANPNAQDENGATPAVVASKAGHADVAAQIARSAEGRGPRAEPPVYYSYDQLQRPGTGAPSAPPMPSAPQAARERDEWGHAVNTPLEPPSRGGAVAYPAIYKPQSHASATPAATSHQGGSEWWQANVGQDLSDKYPPPPQQHTQGHEHDNNPRKQFEDNILRQAQGVWRMLQGKPKDGKDEEQRQRDEAERKRQEDEEVNEEWGGVVSAARDWAGRKEPGGVPSTTKYDTRPFEPEDDDEYRTDAPKGAVPQHGGGGAQAQVRQRLEALEREMDEQQGWVRGGTKAEAKVAAQQKERLAAQEGQIRALRQQLENMQMAASRARTGNAGRRAMDGAVPAEYICPITQEIMEEPVLAADGFSYERSAILQWLQLGHTTSPMTNEPLQHPGLTSNRALRAAIQQWKSQPVSV